MVCFCHQSLQPLRLAWPSLNASVAPDTPHADAAIGLGNWLGAHGQPASPWAPDPDWLHAALPRMMLNAQAMATVCALAQLRAMALAECGLDLLQPATHVPFARLVATMNARLSAMPTVNGAAWIRQGALLQASDQIALAVKLGLFAPSLQVSQAMAAPAGIAMPQWHAFLRALLALAPVIALAAQLGLSVQENFAARLSVQLATLRAVALPAFDVAASLPLTAALSAVANLRAGLGTDPLRLGLPAVHAMVAERVGLAVRSAATALRVSPRTPDLLSLLPKPPFNPSGFATAPMVRAALSVNAQALAAMTWSVPAMDALPVLRLGMPALALATQANAAMAVQAVARAPCCTCDAASLMRAAAA